MVYDRKIGGKELSFEASGALLEASLVMRDRETDSWWSIMSSEAIGGELENTELLELPLGQKVQFGTWREKHPDTLVLSVDGVEHVENNPYDNYFRSSGTFRGLQVADDRLPPKATVYAFWVDDRPWAVPHDRIEGGRAVEIGEGAFFFYRPRGASFHASTRAFRLSEELRQLEDEEILERLQTEAPGFEPLEGFDTYWYTWAAVNEASGIAP